MKFRTVLIPFSILFLSFVVRVSAQTPGTSQYPGSLDTRDTLIQTANSASTSLSLALGVADTSATVSSTSLFPLTGTFTVDTEIFFYTGKTATTFTGLLRGQDGSAAAAHASGSSVQLRIISRTHMVQSDAIINIQTKLGFSASTPALDMFLIGTGTGSSAWQKPSNIASAGALSLSAGGINQNVTLTPSGTGYTILNGNVSIGTMAPTSGFKLDVNGSGLFQNDLRVGGTNGSTLLVVGGGGFFTTTIQARNNNETLSLFGTRTAGSGQPGVNIGNTSGLSSTDVAVQLGAFDGGKVYLLQNGNIGIGTISINSGQRVEINGGLNLTTATAQPACNATTRGTFWVVQSAAGVKDKVEVCSKDAADVYAWRVIY